MIATILTGRLGSWSTWRSRTSEAAEMSVRATAVRAPSAGGRPSAVGRTTRRRDGQTGQVTDVIRVDDPADPRLADYLRLTDSSLHEPGSGTWDVYRRGGEGHQARPEGRLPGALTAGDPGPGGRSRRSGREIGRASCRERV